jgi:hypothetical protein
MITFLTVKITTEYQGNSITLKNITFLTVKITTEYQGNSITLKKTTFKIIYSPSPLFLTQITVSVFASIAVIRGFNPWPGQTKDKCLVWFF